MSSLDRIPLNDGTSAPWLAFGTGTALYNKDVAKFVEVAITSGVTHLDGAQMYRNEQSLGEGIKASGKPRSELYLVTKLFELNPGQTVKDTLVESLAKFGVDYVDLFLIHSPLPYVGRLKEIWQQMEGVKNEGLTKSIGVSNFKVEHLNELLEGANIVPAVNQVS
jgi:diketogulonate reductase-like aldo/keto reductase